LYSLPQLTDPFRSQNDCTESSDGLKATGTFLPRLGSSESLETDKISIQDQLSEANPQTLTELHEEQLLAEIPLATSIQRHAHRSFTGEKLTLTCY